MNYTYILTCSDGTFYCGWTNDLDKRLKAHNSGTGAKYTKTRRPVVLSYYEAFETKAEAMRREYAIKQLPRRKKEQLLEEFSGYKLVHHHVVAETAAHDKEMKDLVGTEVAVPVVEKRKLQCVDDSAQGVDNAACQEPGEAGCRKGADDLGNSQNTYPSHGDVDQ